MASIPLLCNICPKAPEFSDISHLLTHVSSKGHLSHYFRAQVKARQDPSIREKLDIFDCWYDRHNIEKLLSERMTAKENKNMKAKKPSSGSKPSSWSKENNSRKPWLSEKASQQPESPSPIKLEGVIDPQLSGFHLAAPHTLSTSPFLNSVHYETAARHRAYVPHMGRWHNNSPSPCALPENVHPRQGSSPQPTICPIHDTSSDSDCFRSFLRSPTQATYPDPAELTAHRTEMSPQQGARVMNTIESPHENSSETDKAGNIASPILKGVKWPGMSLFDSASFDQQRRRNQKKDNSTLERMELNSVAVEQIERIYWPDGALKQARLITGNVESSPSKSPTPPPAPSKRRRNKANRTVLEDLSTNGPRLGRKPRPRKTNLVPARQASNLQQMSGKALNKFDSSNVHYPLDIHMAYDPADEDETQRQLTYGRGEAIQKRAFEIFIDDSNDHDDVRLSQHSTTKGNGCRQTLHGHEGVRHSCGPRSPRRNPSLVSKQPPLGPRTGAHLHSLPWTSRLYESAKAPLPYVLEDSENVEPVLDGEGRVDDIAGPGVYQRVTQRYFSVTGNQPPQFYNSLPPQMDFGGLAEPRVYGSTINPLNSYLRQHLSSYQAPPLSHHQTSIAHFADGRKAGRPPPGTGRRTPESREPSAKV